MKQISFLFFGAILPFVHLELCQLDMFNTCIFWNVSNEIKDFSYPGNRVPKSVVFLDSNLTTLPKTFLKNWHHHLEELNVDNSLLQVITITPRMKTLSAANNYIEYIRFSHVGSKNQCNYLEKVNLNNNQLQVVGELNACTKIRYLNLANNGNRWHDGFVNLTMFKHFTNLIELNLSNNGIFYLGNSPREYFPHLKTLVLSGNDLIESDLRIIDWFQPLTSLETLYLDTNRMPSIDYVDLTELPKLQTVYLNGNDFDCTKVSNMLKFLNEHNISTPTEQMGDCADDPVVLNFCCRRLNNPITMSFFKKTLEAKKDPDENVDNDLLIYTTTPPSFWYDAEALEEDNEDQINLDDYFKRFRRELSSPNGKQILTIPQEMVDVVNRMLRLEHAVEMLKLQLNQKQFTVSTTIQSKPMENFDILTQDPKSTPIKNGEQIKILSNEETRPIEADAEEVYRWNGYGWVRVPDSELNAHMNENNPQDVVEINLTPSNENNDRNSSVPVPIAEVPMTNITMGQNMGNDSFSSVPVPKAEVPITNITMGQNIMENDTAQKLKFKDQTFDEDFLVKHNVESPKNLTVAISSTTPFP